jgi:hypothetical protein
MQKKRRKRKNEAISSGEWRVANYPEDLPISFAIPP